MRTTIVSLAALGLMTGLALAQTTQPPAGTTGQQPGATGQTQQPGTTAVPEKMGTQEKMGSQGSVNWYKRANDDWPASEIMGTTVRNTAGENIGDVNELILSSDGKVRAVIIGVGGFLGLGERDVAVAFDSLKVTRDEDNDEIITVDANKDVLTNAPRWERPQRTGG